MNPNEIEGTSEEVALSSEVGSSTRTQLESTAEVGSVRDAVEKAFSEHQDDSSEETEDLPTHNQEEEPWQERSAKEESEEGRREEKEDTSPQEPNEQAGEGEPILPPATLTAAEKELFAKAPKEVQEAWAEANYRVVSGFTRKATELSAIAKEYENIDKVIRPHKEAYLREGKPIDQVISRFLEWDKFFKEDKFEAARSLLADLDIEPEELAEIQAPEKDPVASDPRFQKLMAEVEALKARDAQADISARENAVTEFAQAKDSNGELAHPYWEEMESTMAGIIPVLRQKGLGVKDALAQAYKMALPAHPEIQQALEKKQKARANATKVQNEKKAAEKAGRATRSVSGGPFGATQPNVPGDVRSIVEAVMEGDLPTIDF